MMFLSCFKAQKRQAVQITQYFVKMLIGHFPPKFSMKLEFLAIHYLIRLWGIRAATSNVYNLGPVSQHSSQPGLKGLQAGADTDRCLLTG